jgi:MFS family permease
MTKTRPRIFFGWWVVLASAVGLLLGPVPILVFSFGVFLKPLAAEFHSGRASISLALTLFNTGYALGVVLAGRLLDRVGGRKVILPAMTMAGLILLSSYFCSTRIGQFYVFFIAAGVASSGAGPVAFASVISQWFDRRRGLALGCMFLGAGAGTMIMPSLAQRLIAGFGWRFAYCAIGAAILLVTVPVIGTLLRDRPEEMGLVPDGIKGARTSSSAYEPPIAQSGSSIREAFRTRTFWLLLVAVIIVSASLHACFGHLPAMLTDRGSSAQAAALASSLFGAGTMIGRAASGWFLDRFFGPRVGAVIFGCSAVGVALLGLTSSQGLAYAAALAMGVGWGTEGDVKAYLISRYFGLRSFGSIFGFIFGDFVLGVGAGGYLMGRVFDAKHSYDLGMSAAFAGMVIGVVLMMLLGPYRYGAEQATKTSPELNAVPSEPSVRSGREGSYGRGTSYES